MKNFHAIRRAKRHMLEGVPGQLGRTILKMYYYGN